MDRQTDGRTDISIYRVASLLKRSINWIYVCWQKWPDHTVQLIICTKIVWHILNIVWPCHVKFIINIFHFICTPYIFSLSVILFIAPPLIFRLPNRLINPCGGTTLSWEPIYFLSILNIYNEMDFVIFRS